MSEALPAALLGELSEFLGARLGLEFPRERWQGLERALLSASRELDFGDVESCVRTLLSQPLARREIETLASHLTVGETYFFREPRAFEALERDILPELIARRRRDNRVLRLWSAGCCTGEEPYSLAILLDRLIPDLAEWRVTILGTDINPRFLNRASAGVYGEWSFRGVAPEVRARHFRKTLAGRYEILPHIRRMVSFSYLNLAEDSYPALLNDTTAMDVVFCRNVLMYFKPERAERVCRALERALVVGGWLAVSPVEASLALFHELVPVQFPGGTLYRRENGASPVAQALLPLAGAREPELPRFAPTGPVEPLPLPAAAENLSARETAAEPPKAEAASAFAAAAPPDAEERRGDAAGRGSTNGEAGQTQSIELLARAAANQGKLGEALEWCERGIAANKLDTGLHYLRAMVQLELGASSEAAASLKRALYLAPDLVVAHFALAGLAQRDGKAQDARRHYANALAFLRKRAPEEVVPESEGMTVTQLAELIARARLVGAAQ